MLEVRGLTVAYGPVKVLHGIDLTIGEGEIVALIGPNGAGKTSTLNAIAGLLPEGAKWSSTASRSRRRPKSRAPGPGSRTPGPAGLPDHVSGGEPPHGGLQARAPAGRAAPSASPRLRDLPPPGERRRQEAGKLSGGEQQMLVIGRALLSEPKIVLIDELSLGLAPKIGDHAARHHRCASTPSRGRPACWSSRPPPPALKIATSAYLLQRGRVVYQGSADRLRSDVDVLHSAYLGQSNGRKDPALRKVTVRRIILSAAAVALGLWCHAAPGGRRGPGSAGGTPRRATGRPRLPRLWLLRHPCPGPGGHPEPAISTPSGRTTGSSAPSPRSTGRRPTPSISPPSSSGAGGRRSSTA